MIGFRSIRSRILAFALLATLVPSLGLGVLTYWRYQAMVSGNVAVELRTLNNYARSELGLWVTKQIDDLRALSNADTLQSGLSGELAAPSAQGRVGTREVEVFLRSVQENLDAVLELSVLDARGRRIAGSQTSGASVALPPGWADGSAVGGPVLLQPTWDSAQRRATLTVVVPIRSGSHAFLGALAGVIDLRVLQGRLDAIARSSAAEVILLSSAGEPLLGTHGAAAELTRIDPGSLQSLLARPGEPVTYAGHRGREVIGLTTRPGSSALWVIAERASADVFRERRRLLEMFVALTAALALLVGVLAYWISRSIVTPLDGLVRAVDRIADGDLAVRLKPTRITEVGLLTGAMNVMAGRLERSSEEVQSARRALEEQNRALEALSVTDGLTGLYNRKKLDSILVEQFALYERHRRPFALLMLDIDHFKALNDKHGHLGGDQMLATVAGILRRCVRSVDQVARYGGEEFAIVLVEATLDGALDTAERIRASVAAAKVMFNDQPVTATISVGVARCSDTDEGPQSVIARADAALYEAKHAGRNRVVCADELAALVVADPPQGRSA
ncbi:MAG TPA: diguanylate cyclase [Burkholderiaceae bacterium]|nr:diguanylate cyclase [Burkholderiaceae bacterium]